MALKTRPLGATDHASSVLSFGGAALAPLSQADADRAVEQALDRGVNHFDVAPFYGPAQALLGPSVERHRDRMFLACKTRERKKFKARAELENSLSVLRTSSIDLYQCHSVSDEVDLDALLGPRGAVEMFEEARAEGLIRYIGITGHHCGVLQHALERYPFDSVMFPVNPMHAADGRPALDYRSLMDTAARKRVGALAIKATARRPWPNGQARNYTTWYEPHDDPAEVRRRVQFGLSHDVTSLVLPSDVRLWPALFEAAEGFEPLDTAELGAMIDEAAGSAPLFVESMILARQAYGAPRSAQ